MRGFKNFQDCKFLPHVQSFYTHCYSISITLSIVILYCAFLFDHNIYKTFGGEVKFKRYLNGVDDAGTRLLFNALLIWENNNL